MVTENGSFRIADLSNFGNLAYSVSLAFNSCGCLLLDTCLLDIADVTNFVHPSTPLDDEASQRGTSVYLVERRIDMLPKPLTEGFLPLDLTLIGLL